MSSKPRKDQRGYRVDRRKQIAKQARREAKRQAMRGNYQGFEILADVASLNGMRKAESNRMYETILNARFYKGETP